METALWKTYSDLVEYSKGNFTLLMQQGLSAEFDAVDVEFLLADLLLLGFGGKVHQWFWTYLKGRSFQVLIRETYCKIGHMHTDVTQGSIMGPIMFVIYPTSLQYFLETLDVKCHFIRRFRTDIPSGRRLYRNSE